MKKAEFEERSYEAPLYNQLERGTDFVYAPGQVLEGLVGFDRGIQLTELALWETLGYEAPLPGAALGYFRWPVGWGPNRPRAVLPGFRLNLFLQAKRPSYYTRRPRRLKGHRSVDAPLWSFPIVAHQQKLLETLAKTTHGRAHVSYASPAFHRNSDLFLHTKRRTLVDHSTFPPVEALIGHDAWYYDRPGAIGVANPDPEYVEQASLLSRLYEMVSAEPEEAVDGQAGLDALARAIREAVATVEADALSAQFFDDVQTLDRLIERYQIGSLYQRYAEVRLFETRFDVSWLVVG